METITVTINLEDEKHKAVLRHGYLNGLRAAYLKAIDYAAQCGGGSGEGGEGYKSLAEAISNIDPDKGY